MPVKNYKSSENKIVRVNHPVLGSELEAIAIDLDVPYQLVFDALITVVYSSRNIDNVLVEVVALVEGYKDELG